MTELGRAALCRAAITVARLSSRSFRLIGNERRLPCGCSPPPNSKLLRLGPVLQDLNLFHGDQPAGHHAVEHRQERVDLLLTVDDLDHERQILRQAQDLAGVKPAGGAEAHGSPQHGGAGQMLLTRLQNDRLAQRLSIRAVILADENTKQHSLFRDLHCQSPFKRLSRAASAYPSQTASTQVTTDTPMFKNAVSAWPARNSLTVSRLKEENVV